MSCQAGHPLNEQVSVYSAQVTLPGKQSGFPSVMWAWGGRWPVSRLLWKERVSGSLLRPLIQTAEEHVFLLADLEMAVGTDGSFGKQIL